MDSSKRRLINHLGSGTVGAALIPASGIGAAIAGTVIRNNNQPDRKGEVGKRYGHRPA